MVVLSCPRPMNSVVIVAQARQPYAGFSDSEGELIIDGSREPAGISLPISVTELTWGRYPPALPEWPLGRFRGVGLDEDIRETVLCPETLPCLSWLGFGGEGTERVLRRKAEPGSLRTIARLGQRAPNYGTKGRSPAVQDFQHLRHIRTWVGLLTPTILRQHPQFVRERGVGWPRRAVPSHYGQCHRNRMRQVEWSGSGEGLRQSVKAISHGSATVSSPQTHLNHDHCKRENIRMFARSLSPLQYFWRSPPRSGARRYAGFRCGALIPGETEVCYTRAVVGAYHDVRLHEFDEQYQCLVRGRERAFVKREGGGVW